MISNQGKGKSRNSNSGGGKGGGKGWKSDGNGGKGGKGGASEKGGGKPHNNNRRYQNNKNQNNQGKSVYNEYVDLKAIEARIALGDVDTGEEINNSSNAFQTLFFGKIRINPRSRKNAFVTCKPLTGVSQPPLPCDVFIEGENERNRALDGDLVAVELLPVSEWAAGSSVSVSESSGDVSVALGALSIAQVEEEEEDPLWRPLFKPTKSPETTEPKEMLCTAGEVAKKGQLQPKGRVVGIIKANHRTSIDGILAPLNRVPDGSCLPLNEKWMVLQPSDKRYPYTLVSRIDIPPEVLANPSAHSATLWIIDLDSEWAISSKLPRARIQSLRRLGEVGDIATEHEALARSYGVDHGHFSEQVLECANSFQNDNKPANKGEWTIPEEEIAKRKDFRNHRIFTIDPTTAKDLDDALHITLMDDGTVEVGVHIADVSHFVQDGSALDEEAQRRATSVYLVHGVIPMLPSVLCEDLCSLNPAVDRLAFSCVWRMTRDGALAPNVPIWFGKSVIRSCAKLDYDTAQRIIDKVIPSSPKQDEVSDADWEYKRRPEGWSMGQVIGDVLLMHEVGMARRQRRFSSNACLVSPLAGSQKRNSQSGGALSLHKTKLCFRRDDLGNPTKVFSYPIKDSNRLVEEYMLIANFLVAQKLVLNCQAKAMLRSHPQPVEQGLSSLQSLFEKLFKASPDSDSSTIGFDSTSAGSLHASLVQLKELFPSNTAVYEACMTILTHPMKPAVYVAAGTKPSEEWRHYALNIPYYTHFTSPIRRYPDIVVHRLLHAIVCDERSTSASMVKEGESMVSKMWSEDQIASCAVRCNEMKEAAKGASERSDHVYLCVLLKKSPVVAEAVVIGVGPKSYTLQIPSLGIEHRACVDDIDGVDSVQHDEASESLTITRSAQSSETSWTSLQLRIFCKIKVKVSCRTKPPLDVAVDLLSFVEESPLAHLDSLLKGKVSQTSNGRAEDGPSLRVNKDAGDRVIRHALSKS
mmetsp:Transcript_18645/g.22144  ORF Transcript_18645/g.22144 Transcript_18645/m.22144 type:complete len:978 (+) Transcript_18645:55-2988(+)